MAYYNCQRGGIDAWRLGDLEHDRSYSHPFQLSSVLQMLILLPF